MYWSVWVQVLYVTKIHTQTAFFVFIHLSKSVFSSFQRFHHRGTLRIHNELSLLLSYRKGIKTRVENSVLSMHYEGSCSSRVDHRLESPTGTNCFIFFLSVTTLLPRMYPFTLASLFTLTVRLNPFLRRSLFRQTRFFRPFCVLLTSSSIDRKIDTLRPLPFIFPHFLPR